MNARATSPVVRTTCPYCGVGCGVDARPDGRGGATIAGDTTHPANFGGLCSKGSALGETLGLETRLLFPVVVGERTTWDLALNHVASGLTPAQIRAWAKSRGIKVNERGRISADIVAKYEAAH